MSMAMNTTCVTLTNKQFIRQLQLCSSRFNKLLIFIQKDRFGQLNLVSRMQLLPSYLFGILWILRQPLAGCQEEITVSNKRLAEPGRDQESIQGACSPARCQDSSCAVCTHPSKHCSKSCDVFSPKQCSLTESAVRTPQIPVGKSSYKGAKRFASLTFKKLFSTSTKSHRLQCYKPRDEVGGC